MFSTDTKDDVETFYYKQVLDHFNYRPESYNTFDQRYFMNFKYWGGANSSAPILVYLGPEEPLDGIPESEGFMNDNATSFKALLVYIEHRYYGKSVPFGSRKEAFKNASTIGYFNSAQTLADYAEVLIDIKKTLQAQDSPVVVIGGSYGGMLASWFRLKYPHLAIGALASSAPILFIDDIIQPNVYFDVVSRDFKLVRRVIKQYSILELCENCKKKYGVSPRPHWISAYYGGHDIKLVLQRFSSNIIFSNGLRGKTLIVVEGFSVTFQRALLPSLRSMDLTVWIFDLHKKMIQNG
ncbi:lysosomal Pro-X carboxypeptidase [Trifolium repens]|nr:lysosomal Pro-X carboxypeptidase [Trifolium repens]